MEYAIGLVVSLAIFGSSTVIGFDRERAFYPAVMIVIAAYYVLFAAMGATAAVLVLECAAASVFVIVAVIGFKTRLWLVAAALAGHGVFDFFHHYIIENPGVPHWWPGFCLAADVVAAVFLAVLLKKRPALAL
jgi:hypothetical protein